MKKITALLLAVLMLLSLCACGNNQDNGDTSNLNSTTSTETQESTSSGNGWKVDELDKEISISTYSDDNYFYDYKVFNGDEVIDEGTDVQKDFKTKEFDKYTSVEITPKEGTEYPPFNFGKNRLRIKALNMKFEVIVSALAKVVINIEEKSISVQSRDGECEILLLPTGVESGFHFNRTEISRMEFKVGTNSKITLLDGKSFKVENDKAEETSVYVETNASIPKVLEKTYTDKAYKITLDKFEPLEHTYTKIS
jgi:hypothetical protein